jgi:hypothetical protein
VTGRLEQANVQMVNGHLFLSDSDSNCNGGSRQDKEEYQKAVDTLSAS